MKKYIAILFAILFVFASNVFAADVTFQWDYDQAVNQVTGYKLFITEDGSAFDYTSPTWFNADAAIKTAVISNLTEGVKYHAVCRAYKDDIDSADSNEVIFTVPEQQQTIEVPAAPKSMIIMFK